jgi:hypothetical protein
MQEGGGPLKIIKPEALHVRPQPMQICQKTELNSRWTVPLVIVPDHDGGRPMEVNACILITHMVYL